MKKIIVTLAMIIVFIAGFSQGLKPIFDKTPKEVVPSKVLVSYPKNTFLENIVKGNDGMMYVTNYPEGKIVRIGMDGTKEDYSKVDGKIAGIAKYGSSEFLVVGWATTGKPSVFLIDENKNASVFTAIEGGMFPNGILSLDNKNYLIADSYAGCIWQLKTDTKTTEVWLKDDLLARSSEKAQIPAANGLKLYKGNLYVSNSEKQILVKIPLINNKPGTPSTYLSNVFIDDFQFDTKGNLYAAANLYNYVLKITPAKTVSIIAGITEAIAGPTSILIDKDKAGKTVLYVPTCGGMGVPPPTGIIEGNVVMLYPR